ncbi:Imm63 family immunity protein [Kitasatospora sp. NPDC089509]|uniref:Imm63 family immunity protein n=1 Tax=Kitasatospora sp. NPDC089509 TaxID=3364079 RepID=UPI0037FC4565
MTKAARIQRRLENEIALLSATIGLTDRNVPTFVNHDGASPFMLVGGNGVFCYLALERGKLCFERSTRDPDELLYWAFDDVTADVALEWTNEQHLVGEEHLAAKWKRRATLLHALDPEWAKRWRAELVEALGPEGEHHLVPTLPPPPLVLDIPEPPAEPVPLPTRRRRWWHLLVD